MIISPPFLCLTDAPVYDAQCIEDTMPGGVVGHGAFPVSSAMSWHGGIHIHAPSATEPVRAIADGIVVYRRENKPVTYQGTAYSTGCVVIRHKTEIGAVTRPDGIEALTSFTYYSITLHLASLDKDLPAVNQPIWRKDRLGLAGNIAGEGEQIHCEIVCGDEDIQSLVGRRTGRLALEQDGRVDALFGTVYVFIPRGAALYAAQPAATTAAPSATTAEDLVIGIEYECGDARLITWRLAGGDPVGVITEPDQSEYRLYDQAMERHRASPAGSSPSAWHELMRLGRKLGPDPLPASAPHWRRIQLSDGSASWIDLNAAATQKYSDADFPHWQGWRLVDDEITDDDSRCDSKMVERLLNTTAKGAPVDADTPQSRMNRLCANDVQKKLARTICKFPTEWSKEDVATRWQWAKDAGNPYNPKPLSASAFDGFVEFAQVLCFWEELPEADRQRLGKKHWHFHPREFITHMRKCSWLSEKEFIQLLPRKAIRKTNGKYQVEDIIFNERRRALLSVHRISQNISARKWGISTALRLACFFGNSIQETQWWLLLEEASGSSLWYGPWHGRGFLQLTNPENYFNYWAYRGRSFDTAAQAGAIRAYVQIARSSRERSNSALQDANFPGIDHDQNIKVWRAHMQGSDLTSDQRESRFAPSDSAGFYWCKNSMAKYSDMKHVVERVSEMTESGKFTYYRSPAFWRVAAVVNLPGAVNRSDYSGLNGFDARCIAYGCALAVLTEIKFSDQFGMPNLFFPETQSPRRTV